MKIQPVSHSVALVLIGAFTPVRFSPQWLAAHNVIDQAQAAAAEIEIVHEEVAKFDLDWCKVLVQRERFQASTNEVPFVRLCDFVTKIFGEVVTTAPIRGVGINVTVNFAAPSSAARDSFGMKLAPPQAWGAWGKEIAESIEKSDGKQPHGGVLSITMRQEPPYDREHGYTHVKVGPAPMIKDNCGISVEVNDHFVLMKSDGPEADSIEYARLIAEKFDSSLSHSESIVAQLMEVALEQ